MDSIPARITQGGRLVIPASVRRSMQLADGEMVMLEMKGGALEVVPLRERLDAVQAACAQVLSGGGVVEAFLQERRGEAAREQA